MKLPSLEITKTEDGLVRLTQEDGQGVNDIVDLHPLQVRLIAEKLGLLRVRFKEGAGGGPVARGIDGWSISVVPKNCPSAQDLAQAWQEAESAAAGLNAVPVMLHKNPSGCWRATWPPEFLGGSLRGYSWTLEAELCVWNEARGHISPENAADFTEKQPEFSENPFIFTKSPL